jgi:histidinol-phosphatase (PHP family)
MRIIEDLHVHTRVSKDSVQEPDAYVTEAIKRGIKYLGFTDHLDLDPIDKDFGYYRYDDALRDIKRLRARYAGKINLLFGVEVTYQSGLEKSILQSTQGKEYDFLMGSVHRLEGYTIAGASGLPFFDGKSEEAAYNMYFDEMEKLVDMNYFHVIGHFDVIKRYGVKFFGPFDASKYKNRIKSILGKVVKSGAVLEINSSGFRQFPKEPYPSKEILQYYVEVGGREITIGSDAHSIKQFGNNLDDAVEYAMNVFDFEVVAFKGGKKFSIGKLSAFFEDDYSKMR